MSPTTDDVRIREIKELAPPSHLLRELPCGERATRVTYDSRQSTHRILHGMDDRLLVVVGPCSIHDPVAAIEYATRLAPLRERLSGAHVSCVGVCFASACHNLHGWHYESAF